MTVVRGDIEGLRAIAVGAVLLYHAGLAWTPGGFVGVDVFFVISGFLITALMIREVERDGRLRLGRFWARRARRLLPASTLVLVFAAAVTVLWLPAGTRKEFGGDIVAAGLYVVNWQLGFREVDYLAEDIGASPVQHYWSLAVEEQFYVVWPLLIALVVTLFRTRRRTALLVAIGGVTALSFAWAVHYSVAQPGLAFFVSTTRVWELGVGALLAIAWPLVRRLPPRLRAASGWTGLAAISLAVLTYDHEAVWPGVATLLPVLGTAAVLLSGGDEASRRGPAGLLGVAPALWVGGLSYSLYLWHWPLLIAAEGIWGDDLRVRHTLLVVAVSVVPAWLSHRFVENPIRYGARLAPTRPALLMGAGTTGIAVGTGVAVIASFAVVDTVRLATVAEAPGAAALGDPAYANVDWATVESVEAMRPLPIRPDTPAVYETRECIPEQVEDRTAACVFGDAEGARTVMLVGDSKAVQWFTPIEQMARAAGWRLVLVAKDGCQFADVIRPFEGQRSPSCDRWSQWALEQVRRERPDVVLTVTRWNRALRPGASLDEEMTREALVDGLVAHWRAVLATGAALVPILDTPGRPGSGVPECVQANLDDLTACAYPKAAALRLSGAPVQQAAAERVPGVRVIDMSDVLCPDGDTCPAVIGNVLVYRSGSHLTDSFAASAREILAERIIEATGGVLEQR